MQAFRVDEALHRTYEAVIEAVARGPITVQPLLGHKASLLVRMPGVERCFHGLLWAVDQQPVAEDRWHVQLRLVPRLALLGLGQDHRLWTDTTLRDVVVEALKPAKISASSLDWQAAVGPLHANVVQRGESDLHFIARILSEAGITFAVQNDLDAERVVFFDHGRGLLPVEGVGALVSRESTRFAIDAAFDLRELAQGRTDTVDLRDYDVERPSTPPEDHCAADSSAGLGYYVHGVGHTQLAGDAARMLQRLRADARVIAGGSYAPALEPGRRLSLVDPARDALSDDWLLVSVSHRGRMAGEGAEYSNRFTAIPFAVQYRPAVVPGPVGIGVQRAFVSGPSGAELHGDPMGRVRVKLAWDRSDREGDRSSTWLRVGQLQLPGSMVVPRVGFEVFVSSEQSDIDRPAVIGHFYNQEQPPPYGGEATISSYQTATTDGGAGSNELRFNDSAGAEEILLNASYDLTYGVGHDATWSVTKDETVDIGSNHSTSVVGNLTATVGTTRSLDVGASETVSIGADASDGVGGSLKRTVGAAALETIGGDQVESVTGALTRTVGAVQLVTGVIGVARKVVGNAQATIGAAWIEMVSDNRMSQAGGSRIETVGALKWIKAKNKLLSTVDAFAETTASQKVKAADRSDNAAKDVSVEIKEATKIKGGNLNFSASDKITLSIGGCTIELQKTGKITVKGKTIILKNAKELAQVLYKGN